MNVIFQLNVLLQILMQFSLAIFLFCVSMVDASHLLLNIMQPSASIRKCIGVTKKGAWGGAKLGKYGAKWGQKVAKLGLFGCGNS